MPESEIHEILTRLGLEFDSGKWRIPTFRPDLTREVDLIEEIARVIGMDAIPARTQARFAPAREALASYAPSLANWRLSSAGLTKSHC